MKETEIAKPLIRWLDAQQWEVYQEVQCSYGGSIADIVAIQGSLVWVIEMKTGLTASVVEQAFRWLHYAHYVSVCTPERRWTKGRTILEDYMRWKGIGLITVKSGGGGICESWELVEEMPKPRLHRKAYVDNIRNALSEAHKTFAEAGNSQGRRWSPFRETSRRVQEIVKMYPGCNLKFLVDNVNHHYASNQSFKANVPTLIRSGVIEGIEIREDGRKLTFFPESACAGE